MQSNRCGKHHPEIRDYGPEPYVLNINHAVNMNENFRTTLWTGKDMQLTLMSIPVGGDIGVEMHPDVDQFIRIESGCARVYMGDCRNALCEAAYADNRYAVIIPAGTWHNLVNAGNRPLKIYSIYAPPQHPVGTVHRTKADAQREGD
ncbi:MAG: cupin domain-containing protein [Clostridia bacterium]|nr:cupin domain-containing protein [Clostridia bacterium]